MKPPSNVRVLGKTWSIHWPHGLEDAAGLTNHASLRIDVDLDQPLEHLQDTLLHELLHTIDNELQLHAGEKRVAAMATVLLQIMKDNPRIRKFIFGA